MIANDPTVEKLKLAARSFLTALRENKFDHLWNDLITSESRKFLSASLYPLRAYQENQVDHLFAPVAIPNVNMSRSDLLALAFDRNSSGERSDLFRGIADTLEPMGWFDFSDENCVAFVDDPAACLMAPTPNVYLVMPFLQRADGMYQVDMVAMVLFSMVLRASMLYEIGSRARELGNIKSAVTFYELVVGLAEPYRRLERLTWGHSIGHMAINDERKQELQEQQQYVQLSKERLDELLAGPKIATVTLDTGKFLASTFRGYSDITRTTVSDTDLQKLYALEDEELRRAIASILLGVDPMVAQREAEKPHGPSEIADMELQVNVDGKLYYLCMPFKSGREIKKPVVGVEYVYQIDRPFYELQNCVVVFVTAKPCSQPLLNRIKKLRDKLGYPIEVIEHKQLAGLLKINKLLK